MRTVQECQTAALALAEKARENAYKETKNIININNNYNKTRDLQAKDSSDPRNSKNIHNIRAREEARKALHRLVCSDKDFKLALSWGMYPDFLMDLIEAYGQFELRQAILTAAKYDDEYFRQWEPIPPQRGKVCLKILRVRVAAKEAANNA